MTHRHPRLVALVFFFALAVLQTWPLATDPAHLSRNDNADTVLNEWILAWVAHQAPRDPVHLYDANIFYPDHDTLAYSESMIVQGLMAIPLFAAGASPVLVYNLLLLAGFTLTGWAMCVVVARWTGDWIAGAGAGVLMAFNAHTLTRLPHMQAQHVEFLPLALLALDALLHEPRVRHAVWLAIWFVLQGLTSNYLLVFTATALVVATLARPEDWWGRARLQKLAPYAALAVATAGVVLLPFILPYVHAYRDLGLVRSLDDVALYSASWRDYLTTPARFHYWLWSHAFFSSTGLFPGFVGLALTGVALATGALRDRRARMCLAFGVAGVALSFGPAMPGYAILYDLLPPLQGIRGAARFGYLGLVAVAVLGGFGLAALRRRRPAARGRLAVSGAVLVLLVLEPLSIPIDYVHFDRIPSIYRTLRLAPPGAVVEFPMYPPGHPIDNARYMLNSTVYWKPLVNGYSGYLPVSYNRHYDAFSTFPDPGAITALRAAGVRYVFVHFDALPDATGQAIRRSPDLISVTTDGKIALYRLAGGRRP
ncbi:MAG: hypothetical protein KGN76_13825 [Acidobacteriota bacterium]|nr:hypothetical protein [Acidobacteriota bacterium]